MQLKQKENKNYLRQKKLTTTYMLIIVEYIKTRNVVLWLPFTQLGY